MINKSAKREVPIDQMFEARKYSDHELQDFHHKIQRFWGEPEQVLIKGRTETARKFHWEDLAVAFGAMSRRYKGEWVRTWEEAQKLKAEKKPLHYAALAGENKQCDRFYDFLNLWRQYESYVMRKSWAARKESEELEKLVAF